VSACRRGRQPPTTMRRPSDTRFDWLAVLTYWGQTDDGCEVLEVALADFVHRSGMTDADWQFAFVSWASARLIRTGEWYEIATRDTRSGIDMLRIVRDPGQILSPQSGATTTT
jgi:hypothetical protein